MPRILLAALAALVLVAQATAAGSPSAQLTGTVAQKLAANNLIRVNSPRKAHLLRVPGSQARISVGQRVKLRGTTLRQSGKAARVLARDVVVVRSVARSARAASAGNTASSDDNPNSSDDNADDNAGPGEVDDDDDCNSGPGNVDDDDDTDDNSGPGEVDDDDDCNSGPGNVDDDDNTDDNAGSGNGDDDSDDDSTDDD